VSPTVSISSSTTSTSATPLVRTTSSSVHKSSKHTGTMSPSFLLQEGIRVPHLPPMAFIPEVFLLTLQIPLRVTRPVLALTHRQPVSLVPATLVGSEAKD
jgi:hypothetical protein